MLEYTAMLTTTTCRSVLRTTHLNKLILETFKAVQADRGHVSILQCDGSFSWLVLSDEGKVLQKNSNNKLVELTIVTRST